MSLEHLISADIPVLSPADTADRALDMMQDNHLAALPLVEHDEYLGLITENELLEQENSGSTLNGSTQHYKPAIAAQAHPLDALRIMASDANIPLLPVLDNEHKYAGAITRDALLQYLAAHSGTAGNGGIIVLSIAPRNYTLYEIARICENEDVSILNVQVFANAEGMLEVTLKLNKQALSAVVSSFERHSYQVLEVYGSEIGNEDIADKYNLLMHYINM